jgi:ribonuclease VapC
MFVDASALLAILLQEPEADRLADAIEAAPSRSTSPIAIFEAVAGIMREKVVPRAVAEDHLRAVLETARIEIVPITDEIGRSALDAFDRYGKGRGHPAQLNMGDCFAYACAKTLRLPLLYKGNDFRQTDLAS